METTPITGSLRTDTTGETYTFSVKAFKAWKKLFLAAYQERYTKAFRDEVPDAQQRETAYRTALKMKDIDIFATGNMASTLPEEIYYRVMTVAKILNTK